MSKNRFNVEESSEEKRSSRTQESKASALDIKLKAIEESKMPEAQKMALLKELGVVKESKVDGKITFASFAKIRSIVHSKHEAMKFYPPALNVRLATLKEWDEIFKNF